MLSFDNTTCINRIDYYIHHKYFSNIYNLEYWFNRIDNLYVVDFKKGSTYHNSIWLGEIGELGVVARTFRFSAVSSEKRIIRLKKFESDKVWYGKEWATKVLNSKQLFVLFGSFYPRSSVNTQSWGNSFQSTTKFWSLMSFVLSQLVNMLLSIPFSIREKILK